MTMTREELQRLYDDCQDGRYGHLVALVDGVRRFLEGDDPTVEIAYLKAKLADVEAERVRLRRGRESAGGSASPGGPVMSHDDIKAALAKVNPTGEQWCIWNGWGPLVGTEDIHAATRIGTSDEDSGVHGRWTEDGDLYGSRDTLEFVASAPTWLAELLAEVDRLSHWKAEALPVIDGLQELGAELGIRLGGRITGPDALAAVKALTARAEAAEQANQRVRAQCDSWSHGNSWNKAARRAILRALDGGERR